MVSVTPRKRLAAFRLDEELIEGLQAIKYKTGAPVAEQVRRAILAWLKANGVTETDRKRVGARKRS